MERMLITVVMMEHVCQNSNKAQHHADKDLVIAFHPVKLYLASTIKQEGHQRSHHRDGTAEKKSCKKQY
jgi:hypothetical protein